MMAYTQIRYCMFSTIIFAQRDKRSIPAYSRKEENYKIMFGNRFL